MPASDHAVLLPQDTDLDPALLSAERLKPLDSFKPLKKARGARLQRSHARRWASLLGGVALAAAAWSIHARRKAAFAPPVEA